MRKNIFAKRLKELRQNAKLTQKQLAEAISVNPKTIGAWEKGQSKVGIRHVFIVAQFFNVKLDDFTEVEE